MLLVQRHLAAVAARGALAALAPEPGTVLRPQPSDGRSESPPPVEGSLRSRKQIGRVRSTLLFSSSLQSF